MLTTFARLLGLISILLVAAPASAQQPASVDPTAAAVKEQQLLEALKPGGSNAITGRVSIPDRRAGSLIHPAGRDWETWRRTTLPWLGAISIVGMIVLLAAFLLARGRIRVDGGLSGRTVERFGQIERFGHWLTATAFVTLALTGLNATFGRSVLLPIMGPERFADMSQIAKYLHNYMSFAFVLGLLMIFVMWVIYNLPSVRDVRWLAQGGGVIGHKHPPAGRFNAGQKIMFWVTMVGGTLLAVTGYMLMFPFSTVPATAPAWLSSMLSTVDGLETASMLHGGIAVLMVAVILAHIYIGTVGMEGAFWAMGSGRVDVNWARQHHSVWADKVIPTDKPVKTAAAPAE